MSGAPLNASDLIFSSAASALKDALGELKRQNLSIRNRLHSIKADAAFVQDVAAAFGLPLVANERCGSWYIPAQSTPDGQRGKEGSVYFKSTDGHFGQWAFSLRRLNLQVLDLIGEKGGCIIVDSTRRGKSMPDALSKTVPIWITILNRLLFPDVPGCHALLTPDDVVSASEHSQMDARLNEFVQQARKLNLDCESLRAKLHGRPMVPLWQRPGDALPEDGLDETRNHVVLCTASNCTSAEHSSGSSYVQGAADDHETWALGMDAVMSWENTDVLFGASDDELPGVIASLLSRKMKAGSTDAPVLISPTTSVHVASNASVVEHHAGFDCIIMCSTTRELLLQEKLKDHYIHLACTDGKIGSRQLRVELPKIHGLSRLLSDHAQPKILVSCHTGLDLAIGVAVAIICRFCDHDGALRRESDAAVIVNKDVIKQRLSWAMIAIPHAKPSRATLQSVNSFLMG